MQGHDPGDMDGLPGTGAGPVRQPAHAYLVEHAPARPSRCRAFGLWPRQGPRATSPGEVFRRPPGSGVCRTAAACHRIGAGHVEPARPRERADGRSGRDSPMTRPNGKWGARPSITPGPPWNGAGGPAMQPPALPRRGHGTGEAAGFCAAGLQARADAARHGRPARRRNGRLQGMAPSHGTCRSRRPPLLPSAGPAVRVAAARVRAAPRTGLRKRRFLRGRKRPRPAWAAAPAGWRDRIRARHETARKDKAGTRTRCGWTFSGAPGFCSLMPGLGPESLSCRRP